MVPSALRENRSVMPVAMMRSPSPWRASHWRRRSDPKPIFSNWSTPNRQRREPEHDYDVRLSPSSRHGQNGGLCPLRAAKNGHLWGVVRKLQFRDLVARV
jgi:hypothetical protein